MGELSPAWVAKFLDSVFLLQRLMSPSPAIVRQYFAKKSILQKAPVFMIHKVVNAIFNVEILSTKDHHENED